MFASGATVRHLSATLAPGANQADIALADAAPANRSFAVLSSSAVGANQTQDAEWAVRGELVSPTALRVRRAQTTTAATVAAQVVTFDADSGASVQTGTAVLSGGSAAVSFAPVAGQTPFVLFSNSAPAGGVEGTYRVRGSVSAAQATFATASAASPWVTYYLVFVPGATVQGGTAGFAAEASEGSSAADPQPGVHTATVTPGAAVDAGRSFALVSTSGGAGRSDALGDTLFTATLTAGGVHLERADRVDGGAGVSPLEAAAQAAWAVVQLPMLPTVTVAWVGDAEEGGADGVFRLTRTGDLSGSLRVNWVPGGTAILWADYESLDFTVFFDTDIPTVDVAIVPIDDTVAEDTKTVIASVREGTGGNVYAFDPDDTATLFIADNDFPKVSVYGLTDAVEGGTVGEFRLVREGDLSAPLTLTFGTDIVVGGTTLPDDYAAFPSSVTFAVGQDMLVLLVTPADDGVTEPTEDVTLSIVSSSAHSIGAGVAAVVRLFDNVAPPPHPVGSGTGLFARYYNTEDLYDLKTTRIDEQVKFYDWHTGGPPGANVGADNFSVQWTGKVQAQFSETYTFYTYSDDGVRLWVDGKLIIDQWNIHSGREHSGTTSMPFVAGQMYDIRMEYYEHIGSAHAELRWSSTTKPKDFIPKSQLYPIVFDLDVNANGSLFDTVDGANDYLPGYEGTVQKVSTGLSFNTDTYTGQRLKLVLNGVGTNDPTITKIEFAITDVSALGGYASNRSHASLVTGNDHDYSFLKSQNDVIRTITRTTVQSESDGGFVDGQMEADKTWVNFYAKDYGAWASLQARVWVQDGMGGEKLDYALNLNPSKDTDGDHLADKWEIQMGQRWTTQYNLPAFTVPEALARFTAALDAQNKYQDAEEKNPDGTPDATRPLVDQAEVGDAHDIMEEYRGYILDGGGFDGNGQNGHTGGHIRLDPARKEILVEVDHAAVLNNLPDIPVLPPWMQTQNLRLKNVLNGASKVFSHAPFGMANPAPARGAGIYMYYLFDETNLNLPVNKVDTVEKIATQMSAHRNASLQSDFFHLLMIDQGATAALQAGTPAFTINQNSPLATRGVVFATTDANANDAYGDATKYPIRAEAYACVIVHELTHGILDAEKAPGFDAGEHTFAPVPNTDVMFFPRSAANRQLATVTFDTVVQKQLKTRTGEGIL